MLPATPPAPPRATHSFKVVLVGSVGVGKTSLCNRYINGVFEDGATVPTLGVAYQWRKDVIGEEEVKISMWDTAGMEMFHALVPMYFRAADVVLCVLDATRSPRVSVDELRRWCRCVEEQAPPTAAMFVAVTKSDLVESTLTTAEMLRRLQQGAPTEPLAREEEQATQDTAENPARAATTPDFQTVFSFSDVSSKTGEGIPELLQSIGRYCVGRVPLYDAEREEAAACGGAPVDKDVPPQTDAMTYNYRGSLRIRSLGQPQAPRSGDVGSGSRSVSGGGDVDGNAKKARKMYATSEGYNSQVGDERKKRCGC